ncbi:MAG: hypothetical protein QGI60_05015 [archaeon]|nr:hypothetical protein [archaeon]
MIKLNNSKIIVAGLFLLMLSGIANAAITVAVVSPTDLNYTKDATLAIVFTVLDSNNERDDYNASIYYSTVQGQQTTTIVTDLNLAAGVEGGATTNCNGTNTAFDTTARTCFYTWDTSAIADTNYYIDVNVYAILATCNEGLICVQDDKNADSGTFVLDKTAPTDLNVTVPAAVRAPGTTVTYAVTDTNSPIAKFWVSTDKGTTYIDNGVATTYAVDCAPSQTNWFYFKATDKADNNSTVSTQDVTCEGSQGAAVCGNGICDAQRAGETAATCPVDCSALCGDSACTHTESPETCALDCGTCGDAICSTEEDCSSCETDCGTCETDPPIDDEPVTPPINGDTPPAPECTTDSECVSNNSCTTGQCINEECSFAAKADGTFCEFGKECVNAECTEIPIFPVIPGPVDTTNYVAIVVVVVIVIGAAYFYFKGMK